MGKISGKEQGEEDGGSGESLRTMMLIRPLGRNKGKKKGGLDMGSLRVSTVLREFGQTDGGLS